MLKEETFDLVKFCFSSLVFNKSFSVFLFRYVASWIDRRRHQSEKANLTILFDKYVPACLDKLRTSFKTITSIPESSLVQVCLRLRHLTFQSWCGSVCWSRQQKFLLAQENEKISGIVRLPQPSSPCPHPPCSLELFANLYHILLAFKFVLSFFSQSCEWRLEPSSIDFFFLNIPR